MAGTVDIVMRHYAGIYTNDDFVTFNPNLPEDVRSLRLRLHFRGVWYHIDINNERFKLSIEPGHEKPIPVKVMGSMLEIKPGTSREFPLPSDSM